jgi:Acyl-CoA synthetases (AMP-forming)/AMP-acid ligases II
MPLEVSYPPTLLQSVLEDAQPIAVCSKLPFSSRVGDNTVVVRLDDGWLENFSQLPAFKESVQVSLDDMAYTVYSSGTTGKPKGVFMIIIRKTCPFEFPEGSSAFPCNFPEQLGNSQI